MEILGDKKFRKDGNIIISKLKRLRTGMTYCCGRHCVRCFSLLRGWQWRRYVSSFLAMIQHVLRWCFRHANAYAKSATRNAKAGAKKLPTQNARRQKVNKARLCVATSKVRSFCWQGAAGKGVLETGVSEAGAECGGSATARLLKGQQTMGRKSTVFRRGTFGKCCCWFKRGFDKWRYLAQCMRSAAYNAVMAKSILALAAAQQMAYLPLLRAAKQGAYRATSVCLPASL